MTPYDDRAGQATLRPVDEVEDDDLESSLRGLSGLASIRLPLVELLTRIAELVVQATPGADGAGLMLHENGQRKTLVTTAPFVAEVDAVQYRLVQGPCIIAAAEGRTIISGSLGTDVRWRRFAGEVSRLGVHSALSLPLVTPDGVLGALNVYARAMNVFDERAADLGEMFAVPASIAVENAQILDQAQRFNAQLQASFATKRVVEQATGIVMSRTGVNEHKALQGLRIAAEREQTKVVVVARRLIDDAVRRAQTRHRD